MKHDYVAINAAKDLGRAVLVAVLAGAALCVLAPWAKASMDAQEEAHKSDTITAEQLDAAFASAEHSYTEQELDELACAIYCEAGSDWISDLTRYYVGDVILNRVESEDFPDTIHEVLTQEYAYGTFAWTGIVFPEYSASEWEQPAIDRAYDVARDVLENGNHTWLYGNGYVWQSENKQSEDSFYVDGFWFGR